MQPPAPSWQMKGEKRKNKVKYHVISGVVGYIIGEIDGNVKK